LTLSLFVTKILPSVRRKDPTIRKQSQKWGHDSRIASCLGAGLKCPSLTADALFGISGLRETADRHAGEKATASTLSGSEFGENFARVDLGNR
jgi:hypothetical protein